MFALVKEPLVSIVMPVYNAEDHLRETRGSLTEQSYKNLEIICVDDGSTDGSTALIEELAGHDPRIRIVSQENSGAGAARNLGMDETKGDYVFFFDADDILRKDAIKTLVKTAEKSGADIVLFGHYRFSDNGKIRTDYSAKVLNVPMNRCILPRDISDRLFQADNGMPWNKFFDAGFLRKTGVRFQTLKNTNDEFFSRLTTVQADKIIFLNKRFVGYRVGNDRSLRGNAGSNYLDCTKALYAIHDELKLKGYYETYEDTYKKLAGYIVMLKLLAIEDRDAFGAFAGEVSANTIKLCEMDEEHLEEKYRGVFRALIAGDTEKAYLEIKAIKLPNR